LRGITEMHALPLRTDDWVRVDFPRLVADLERLGVQRIDRRSAPATASSGRRRVAWLAGVTALLAVVGLLFTFRLVPVPTAPGVVANAVLPQSLEGDWVLETPKGEQIPLHVRHRDDRLVMRSDPVRVDDKPNWQSYIESVASVNGTRLTHVRFTAEGQVFGNEADLAVVVISVDDGFVVDTGNLHLRIAPDRRALRGQVSLNSGEQEAVALTRSR
ncbi:MAG TPA: TIR domain-containing protein, partial [Methyloversatilis sp.]